MDKQTCGACGLSGVIGFTATRRGVRCQPCHVHDLKKHSVRPADVARIAAMIVLLNVIGSVMTFPQPTAGWGWPDLATVAGSLIVGIVVHELGHAAIGAITGFRVFAIVVGAGPRLLRVGRRRCSFELRLLPFGGATMLATDRPNGYRLRHALAVAAGPAATGMYAWVLAAGLPAIGVSPWAASYAVFAQVLNVAGNLLPWRFVREGVALRTDGALLLESFRLTDQQIADRVARYDHVEQHQRVERAGRDRGAILAATADTLDTDRVGLGAVHHTITLTEEGRWRESVEVTRRLLAKAAEPEIRAYLLNGLAFGLAVLGEDLDEAERASADALELLPWSAAFQGTRGSVLIALGHVEPGLAWLDRSQAGLQAATYRKRPQWRSWIGQGHAFRALGFVKRGNLYDARRALELARRGDPSFPVIATVEAALAAPLPR